MNILRSENRVRRDAARVKKNIGTLVDDSGSYINQGIETVSSGAQETVVDAVTTVKRDVGQRVRRFNSDVQAVANKYLGNVGKKATKYPWVSISIVLVLGFLLGSLIKPARQPLG